MTPAATPTPERRETRQISPINAESDAPISPITFPARPIRGGKLELAPKKIGSWWAEPKYNGWRALVHCPTGTMWNRHGLRLTIEAEFRPALGHLKELSLGGLVWADCEALERRHSFGRGTLIVLDWVPESGSPGYDERRAFLSGMIEIERLSSGQWDSFPKNTVLLPPSIRDEGDAALSFYHSLKEINRRLRADFFEGVVMKRGNAPYPAQLRSDTEECRGWCKHRFIA